MALDAGSLNRKITIQSQTTTQDVYGQPQQTWTDVLSTWASIKAATSKEVYAAAGFTSQISHKITIRFPRVTLRSNMRVMYRGRVFDVQAVTDPDEGRVQLDLLCLERNEGQ